MTKAKAKLGGLKVRSLKKDAVPTTFPNLAPYFSTDKPEARSGEAAASSRWAKESERVEVASSRFLDEDRISSLQVYYYFCHIRIYIWNCCI